MKLSVLLSIISVAAAANVQYCQNRNVTSDEQLHLWNDFVGLFYYDKNVTGALTKYFRADLKEHAPTAPPGTVNDTIVGLTGLLAISNFSIFHTALVNNIGWVHLRQDTKGSAPEAIADIFQFATNGSCIVEHWDITQARDATPVNPIALWDPNPTVLPDPRLKTSK